jgi:ABC-type glycerol-3-phosphate transport system substrate-binding protein
LYQQGETLYNYGGKTADDGKTYYQHFMEYMEENHDEQFIDKNTYQVTYKEKDLPEYASNYPYYVKNANGTYTFTYPKTDGMYINLDSDISLATFKEACRLSTHYDFPVSYDFANRFRTGEMPLAWTDYGAYNHLIVFAPEINGLWEFTPMPGYREIDGSITNTALAGVGSMCILRGCTEENAFSAWTFIQWWTSAQIQSDYGNELEALLGPSAKYNTANMEALYNMPWSRAEYDNLIDQFENVTLIPDYPGGYIIGRYCGFAFLSVYNDGAEPVETLKNYMEDINNEFDRKRKEFGLCTSEDFENATFLD